MRINVYQIVTLLFLVFLVVFWAYIYSAGSTDGTLNYTYSFLFGLIPLIGGIVAMIKSKIWGMFGSAVGKAVFFIGLGLFCWGMGETIWSYYNFFLHVPAPYPSLADLGFAPSIFFYGLGAMYLSLAMGAKLALRSKLAKIFAVITPFVLLLISYGILVNFARGGVLIPTGETLLKTILDIAYPLGDFLALALAVIISGLSFKYFGGRYKLDIISILWGLVLMFFADTIFSYTTTNGTYYNANVGDLMLTVGLFLLTFGVLGFAKTGD